MNTALHNLSEVECFGEVLGRVCVCYVLPLCLWRRISFQALSVLCVSCAYPACLLNKCLHPVPVISQEGIAFSAFV